MPIITVSRQYGAGGAYVGRALAERFGARYLDREVLAAVAERAGIPESEAEGYDERLPGLWQRIASALATSGPEISLPPVPTGVVAGAAVGERLAALTRAVIEEAAQSGNAVILGRGGAFILGREPGTLHVQLHASVEGRVRFLLSAIEEVPADIQIDEASLRGLCRRVDDARARYLRQQFGVDWNDFRHYDLAVDTGRLGLANTVDLVEAAARRISAETDVGEAGAGDSGDDAADSRGEGGGSARGGRQSVA